MAARASGIRNMRAQLQEMLGTRATVEQRVYQTDRQHPSVGWWAWVHVAEPDCSCAWCASATASRQFYIGYHVRDAMVAISDYLRAHPDE